MTEAELVTTIGVAAGTTLVVRALAELLYGARTDNWSLGLVVWVAKIIRRPISEPPRCLVMDESDDPGDPHGVCNLPAGHPGVIHAEWRDGELWAQWRSILPGDESIRWGGGDHRPR